MSDDDSLDRAERINERRSGRSRSTRERSRSDNSEQTDDTDQSDGTDQTNNSSNSNNTEQMNSTTQTSNPDETPVREKKHVPMYLSEEKAEQLDLYFEELSLRYRREHGERLQKNRDFYPALVESVTEDKDIETVLGLSNDG